MNIISKIHQYRPQPWWQRGVGEILYIAVHHTANANAKSDEEALNATYNAHVNGNKWQGISYHFYITKSGNIYQLNNLSDLTWTDGSNRNALAICLDGDFTHQHPTEAQTKSLQELLDNLCNEHPEFPAGQANVKWHGEISATSCCGTNLINLVRRYRESGILTNQPQPTPEPNQPPIINTMSFKQEIIQLLNGHPLFYEERKKVFTNGGADRFANEYKSAWDDQEAKRITIEQLSGEKVDFLKKMQLADDNYQILLKKNEELTEELSTTKNKLREQVSINSNSQPAQEMFSFNKFFVGLSRNGMLYSALVAVTTLALNHYQITDLSAEEIWAGIFLAFGGQTITTATRNLSK